MVELSLWADFSHLAAVRDFVTQVGHDLGLDNHLVYDLQLAVDEACTNVIQHAYGGRGGDLAIRIEAVAGGIRVIVRDWGQAFDPGTVPLPDVTAPLDRRPLGGLGLFLIRQVMDQVDFWFNETDGNTLIMIKRLEGSNQWRLK
jgi:serine/threonine-protein kinase RsbW